MQRYIPVNEWPSEGVDFVAPRQPWMSYEQRLLPVFAPVILEFVDCLAERLRCLARAEPDMAAFGFWLRPAALRQQAIRMQGRAPLGMVFHLVPSNVPMVAFYSWMMALLMGNSSVIRLSSRQDPVQDKMLALLNELFDEPRWEPVYRRTRFIRYEHNEAMTQHLSIACRLRIVWGGNETVLRIRTIPLAAQAQELVFPDRRSLALIDTTWLAECDQDDWHRSIVGLQQDCCRFNQQACSSPTTLIWIGEPADELRQRFLQGIFTPFAHSAGATTERLVNVQRHLSEVGEGMIEQLPGVTILTVRDPRALRVEYPGGGVIVEWVVPDLDAALAAPLDAQTCLWVGGNKAHLLQTLKKYPDCHIDRVACPGQALAFDWFWDGQDLLQSCSRCIRE